MKNLITLIALLISLSFSSFAQVTIEKTSDSTYTITNENLKTKYGLSALKRQITSKLLKLSDIVLGNNTVSYQETEKTYINSNGDVAKKKARIYLLNGDSYNKLTDMKKALPTFVDGTYKAGEATLTITGETCTLVLLNQTKKDVVRAQLRTVNVRTNKDNPVASQTITILGETFEIKKYSVGVQYTNIKDSTDKYTKKENRYSVNGTEYKKISEVKKAITTQLGIQ